MSAIDGSTKGVHGDFDILQFSAPIYFAEKDEGTLRIDIMRLGHLRGQVSVQFHTLDGSAKAGDLYTEQSGTVVLGDGESDASIRIPIIRNNVWAPTLEFKVKLKLPQNAVLGKYLHTCRVKIIDKDLFPSSKYRKQIEAGDGSIEKIPGLGLLWEYCLLNFRKKGMRRRTLMSLVMQQLHNAYFAFTVYISIFLVDEFFKTPINELDNIGKFVFKIDIKTWNWDEKQTAMFIGIAYAVPMLLLHLWDYIEVRLDVRGRSRSLLQASLFRKYLNYSEESRVKILASDMQIAILQDADAVAESYMALLRLTRMLGKLLVMSYFVAITRTSSLWMVGAMCGIMLVSGHFRSGTLAKASDRVNEQLAEVGNVVADTCQGYRLVADYAQRPQINERFAQMVDSFGYVDVPATVVKLNNNYIPKWLGPIFIAIFISLDAPNVFTGDITLGSFLAALGIFNQIGVDFEIAYEEILEITKSIGLLRSFTKYFNLPTDLLLWKSINRRRRSMTADARDEVLKESSTVAHAYSADSQDIPFRSDTIPIKIVDMSYIVGNMGFVDVNLHTQQGRLVAVVGPHGSGKSTFLKLVAHNLFSDKGTIFIPTHLRILHVTQEPLMMNFSLWRNLLFGCPDPTDVDPERVKAILTKLGMPKTLELVAADMNAHPHPPAFPSHEAFVDILTYTERVKVHLARALIMNAEVTVFQRPLHHFEATSAELVLALLRDHVTAKGLGMPQGNAMRHRRPRTCFFSPESVKQARQADNIWQISKVGINTSTVHLALPQELTEGFVRGLEASPMSLMDPTVAKHLAEGFKKDKDKASYQTLSDQVVLQLQ